MDAKPDGTGPGRSAGTAAIAGWVLFDWAAQPFYTLVLTFLFAPYFANQFIGDPVWGQTLWGYLTAGAGLAVAIAGPVLGAVADASGRRKRWIGLFSITLMIALCGLWLAEARTPARIPVVAASFVLAVVSAEFATIFTNAMMPDLVPRHQLGRLSGTGWAVGYAGGLVSLVIAAGLLVADPETGVTILGLKALLPLDAFAYEGERAIGPFSALWYGIFVLPFFLFTPDRASAKAAASSAFGAGLKQLIETFRQLRRYGAIFRFLLARMLYVDGLGAIFTFGGLYAASVFGWGTLQLGLFGIILTIAGAAGAFAGGWLDDAIGSRALILGALAGIMVAALGIVSVDRDTVLFVMEVEATKAGSVPFASPAEQVYIGFASIVGLLAGPLQSGSRTYLARAAPPDMMTEFFGLFALSGKVSAFAAPLLVGAVTAMAQSQRAGVAVILLFLAGGFAVMLSVPRVTPEH